MNDQTPKLNRDEIITQPETEKLIEALIVDAEFHPYAIYGLMFLFGSIKKSLEAGNRSDIENICLTALIKLYSLSGNAYEAIERVTRDIHVHYRAADFENDDYTKTIEPFVKSECDETANQPTAAALDLSDSSTVDLAQKLSDLLKDERLPAPVYSAIMHGIDDINNELDTTVLQKIEETPEYVAQTFAAYEKQQSEAAR